MRARFALLLVLASCKAAAPTPDPPDAPASPQAKAIPAPLAKVPTVAPSGAAIAALNPDAGPPPSPLRGDRGISPDSLGSKELAGYTLSAAFRSTDIAGSPKASEVSVAGVDAARKKTEPRVTIDMSASRMRIVLASPGFVLPEDTELRGRVDRYGHMLLWPGTSAYRIAAPGSLRALLGERRLDVAPLSVADVALSGDGARRLGLRTRRVEVVTRAANASFEIARVTDSGEGGVLLCRALLDLINAPPSTPLCGSDEMPLHAELRWTTHGAITFDAYAIARRTDLSPQSMAMPPASASFTQGPPSATPGELLLLPADLTGLRTGAVDVATPDGGQTDPEKGLVLVNATDELRMAWLDGAAAAWIAPGARLRVTALHRGRYTLQWRTFLGDAVEPGELVVVPGVVRIGDSDAGAP